MIKHHIYDPTTGLFTGKVVGGPTIEAVLLNVPVGMASIDSALVEDWKSQRVVDGTPVDYIPTSPGDDYMWFDDDKRWVLKPEVIERNRIIAELNALETKQGRMLRESRLGYEGADERLRALDQEMAALRATLP